jgi:hypothetical protein
MQREQFSPPGALQRIAAGSGWIYAGLEAHDDRLPKRLPGWHAAQSKRCESRALPPMHRTHICPVPAGHANDS